MRYNAELLKALRHCSKRTGDCSDCPRKPIAYCQTDMAKDAADALEELLAAVPQWVSVEERLPEAHHSVLCYCPQNNCTYTAVWNGKAWIHFGASIEPVFYPVTHWMTLPEPPAQSSQATPPDITPAGSTPFQ